MPCCASNNNTLCTQRVYLSVGVARCTQHSVAVLADARHSERFREHIGVRWEAPMLFTFPEGARWNAEQPAVEFGVRSESTALDAAVAAEPDNLVPY